MDSTNKTVTTSYNYTTLEQLNLNKEFVVISYI